MIPTLYIVVPCYNEEEVIEETTKRLSEKLSGLISGNIITADSRIMYVNDGSKDKTAEKLAMLYDQNKYVTVVTLSKNKGHQNALLAGLMTAKEHADIVISMDADLQDDIEAVDKFIEKYNEGAEIVYGVRNSRKTDSAFKRSTALAFYKVMAKLGVEMVYNHADYRLMSKRALYELEKFKEVNLFLRGIIPMIGFKTATVEYARGERFAGKSKYPLKKMSAFAIDGITSCSIKPIRMITSFGFLISLFSLFMLIWVIVGALNGGTVAGWPSLMVLICFFSGFQIMSIGIVGEYVGKIYMETKERPRYIIDRTELK